MSITFIEKANNTLNTGTSLAVTKGGSTADGHALLAAVCYDTNTTVTAPSGWTQIQNGANAGNTFFLRLYWKVASSEGASWTWTFGASTSACAAVLTYSGCDATNPVETFAGPNLTASSTTVTSPAGLAAAAGEMLVRFFAAKTSTSFTTPGGHTERVDTASTTDGLAVDELALSASGAFSSATSTIAFAADNFGSWVTLQPPIGDTTDYTPLWMPSFTQQPNPLRRLPRVGDDQQGRIRPDVEDVLAVMAWSGQQPQAQPRRVPRARTPAVTALNPLPVEAVVVIPNDPAQRSGLLAQFARARSVALRPATANVTPPPLLDVGDVLAYSWIGQAVQPPRRRRFAPAAANPPPVDFTPLMAWVSPWAPRPRTLKRAPSVPPPPGRLLELSDAVAVFQWQTPAHDRPRPLRADFTALVVPASVVDAKPPPEDVALHLWPQTPDRPRPRLRRPGPTTALVFWPVDDGWQMVVAWAAPARAQPPERPRGRRRAPSTSQPPDVSERADLVPFVQVVTPRLARRRPTALPHTDRSPGDAWTLPPAVVQAWVTQQRQTPRARPRPLGQTAAPVVVAPNSLAWFVGAVQPRRLPHGPVAASSLAEPPWYAATVPVVLGPYWVAAGGLYCAGAVVGTIEPSGEE